MEVRKHEPPPPVPQPEVTFTLEVTEHEADLIRLAIDLAGTPTSTPVSTLTAEIVSEMDGLYVEINREVGYREVSLERLGLPIE